MDEHQRAARKAVEDAVVGLLDENAAARKALVAMTGRGLTQQTAREEIARCLLGWLWTVAVDASDATDVERLLALVHAKTGGGMDLDTVLGRLAAGESSTDIFC